MKKLLGIVVLGLLLSSNAYAGQVKQVKFCQFVGGNWNVEINLEMYRKRLPNSTVNASICPWVGENLNEISEQEYVAKKMEDINPRYSKEQHIKRIIAIRKPYLIHGLNTDYFDREILKSYKKFLSKKKILLALNKKEEPTQITKKEPKKTEGASVAGGLIEKKTTTSNTSPELKIIEDMYKSGALTKKEYEEAKNRALK